MSPGERIFAGICLVGLGVGLWVLAARPVEEITRFALPSNAAVITPQMLRLLAAARRPLAAVVCIVGVFVSLVGVVQAL